MESRGKLNYGSTLALDKLPKEYQDFEEYLNNATSLSKRSIKNYVNGIYQLFNVGFSEFSEAPEVGSKESLKMIDKIKALSTFKYTIKVGKKEAINYKQMNKLWSNNYSAAYKYYKDFLYKKRNDYLKLPDVYAIRTNQEENVNSIQSSDAVFEFGGIYNYQSHLKNGDIIFSVLGGDKPAWDTGFKSIGAVTRPPFDSGYTKAGRNTYFKIEITNRLVIDTPLVRDDFYAFPDTINASFIGPTTKGEANQAIRKLEDRQVLGIIHGIIDLYPEYQDELESVFSKDIVDYALKNTTKLISNDGRESFVKEPRKNTLLKSEYINDWEQKIYYGAPGTGKSFRMKEEYPEFKRVTFHPEYSFTDFVGGLRPVQKKTISYEFVSGPLTDSIIEAIENPGKKIGIIIEEINRGNTAAIFGDTFQLLDRDETGWSEYGIVNKDVMDYLALNNINLEEIKFPSNLSIIATMNNADQGIYVMDSAFKRRWEFEYVKIDFEKSILKDDIVAGFGIKWSDFGSILNDYLSTIGVEEDKLIGQYFLNSIELKSKYKVASKLFIYLWDDVARYNREAIFSETNNFSKLLDLYEKNGAEIFNKTLRDKIKSVANE